MRYCPQCGAQPQANARFCTHCGTRLPASAPAGVPPLDVPTVIAPAEPVRNSEDTMVLPHAGPSEMLDDATHLAPAPQTYNPAPGDLSEMFAANSTPIEPRLRIGEQFATAQADDDQTSPKAPGIGAQFAQATAQLPLSSDATQSSVQLNGDDPHEDDAAQRNMSKLILAMCILVILAIIALVVFFR